MFIFLGEPNHHVISSKENGCSNFVGNGTTALKYPLVIGEEDESGRIVKFYLTFHSNFPRHEIQHSISAEGARNRLTKFSMEI